MKISFLGAKNSRNSISTGKRIKARPFISVRKILAIVMPYFIFTCFLYHNTRIGRYLALIEILEGLEKLHFGIFTRTLETGMKISLSTHDLIFSRNFQCYLKFFTYLNRKYVYQLCVRLLSMLHSPSIGSTFVWINPG